MIGGVMEPLLIEPQVFVDDRGFFFESYNHRRFEDLVGGHVTFVQDNHSRSTKGVLRGLHYQVPPAPQGKLVRVSRGGVYDVAVDIRRSSQSFGTWVGHELTEDNFRQLWIPPGFAHGFLVLTDLADVQYKTTEYYVADLDRSLRWDDPDIGVAWPLDDVVPIVSPKDQGAPTLVDADLYD
jgi:dTDP-4-dehydrorhamnose 3,5-epimerase